MFSNFDFLDNDSVSSATLIRPSSCITYPHITWIWHRMLRIFVWDTMLSRYLLRQDFLNPGETRGWQAVVKSKIAPCGYKVEVHDKVFRYNRKQLCLAREAYLEATLRPDLEDLVTVTGKGAFHTDSTHSTQIDTPSFEDKTVSTLSRKPRLPYPGVTPNQASGFCYSK